ncbi:MAG: hypothetical protein NZ518_05070 [Dehalococcoidia bacterium]|nr:hypothetical protein [Dehalococcoidia bacterium]
MARMIKIKRFFDPVMMWGRSDRAHGAQGRHGRDWVDVVVTLMTPRPY